MSNSRVQFNMIITVPWYHGTDDIISKAVKQGLPMRARCGVGGVWTMVLGLAMLTSRIVYPIPGKRHSKDGFPCHYGRRPEVPKTLITGGIALNFVHKSSYKEIMTNAHARSTQTQTKTQTHTHTHKAHTHTHTHSATHEHTHTHTHTRTNTNTPLEAVRFKHREPRVCTTQDGSV